MRQAGILAAAAKIVLTENVPKLAKDHENAHYLAKMLANKLAQISGVSVNLDHVYY